MEKIILPLGSYEKILSQLEKWKVLSLKDLCTMMANQVGYKGLSKQIKKLEEQGFVSSLIIQDKSKFLYLTNKGVTVTAGGVSYDKSEENLNHDLKCSLVLREFIKYKNFIDGQMLDDRSDRISPDAKIVAKKNNNEYVLALELELNQKSKDRIKEKFKKYSSNDAYSYVLYVFQKPEVMSTYSKILGGMSNEIQNKIILLLDANLSIFKFDYELADCFFKGEHRNFESIFG